MSERDGLKRGLRFVAVNVANEPHCGAAAGFMCLDIIRRRFLSFFSMYARGQVVIVERKKVVEC